MTEESHCHGSSSLGVHCVCGKTKQVLKNRTQVLQGMVSSEEESGWRRGWGGVLGQLYLKKNTVFWVTPLVTASSYLPQTSPLFLTVTWWGTSGNLTESQSPDLSIAGPVGLHWLCFSAYFMPLLQVLYSRRASWKKQHLKGRALIADGWKGGTRAARGGVGDMNHLTQGEGVGKWYWG